MITKKEAEAIYDSGKENTIAILIAISNENDSLKEKVASLSKNSSNSHKPPSSDIVNPVIKKKKAKKGKRKIGGQPNHPKHEHLPFKEKDITIHEEYHLDICPNCHSKDLHPMPEYEPRIIQQIELQEHPIDLIEHKSYPYLCEKCGKVHYMPFPVNVVKEGLFKEKMSTLVCYLKYKCNVSYTGIKLFLLDVFGEKAKVSDGYLAKIIQKGAAALDPSYMEIYEFICNESHLNVDETRHRENKEKFWTWVFRAELYAFFKIEPSRGSQVLIDVLGEEFNGVLGCDYFSAYHKYMKDFNVTLQFCIAHLIRDLKYMVDFHNRGVKKFGKKLLKLFRQMFKIIHEHEDASILKGKLTEVKNKILKVAAENKSKHKLCINMARRFELNGEAYFEFITTPEIGPTNNIAEQAIRFIVIYRKMSQGTRSEKGRFACERFWTAIATCAIQGKSVFEFIKDSFHAFFYGEKPPSLLQT